MRILGREFGRSRQITTGQADPETEGGLPIIREKAARIVSTPSGPWMPIVRESFSGAWQQNVEVNQTAVLAFHAVFSCMTLIASDISKLRVKLVSQDKHGIWAETTRPAYSPVLRKPNGFQTRIQFFESWFLSKLSSGNTYVLKRRDARNVVIALYVLDPHRVKPLVADDGSIFYELQQDDISEIAGPMVVPAREIIHDRFNCLFHPLVGVSPIYANGLAATQGLRIQDNSAVFFGNQSRPGGLLSAPGKISPESAAELKANWYEYYGGKNSGRVAVLGDGLKYEHMAVTAKDAELIDQLKWTAEVVCSTFHVPPYKLGIGNLPTNSNVESLNLEYYTQALQSLIEAAELCLDEGLGIGEGMGIGTEFDLDGLLRMDTKALIEAEALATGAGIKKIDEARRRLDLGPIPGGDTPYLQEQNYSLAALAKRDAREDPWAKGQGDTTPAAAPPADPAEVAEQSRATAALYKEYCRELLNA
ncbi:phage portal protein [Sphingomonas sp. CFBP 13706]|uniref:phage portal protein n=1 Tax=Sphingomonas sp. CFBP 13706 TaxID=2775314 RepID=UPI001786988A|nr:phage portal protein [Sphingomonas sp. CFBP 13706]MBD8733939.1 phage portal protein [Sphingomonas sp. CFBP 13706]